MHATSRAGDSLSIGRSSSPWAAVSRSTNQTPVLNVRVFIVLDVEGPMTKLRRVGPAASVLTQDVIPTAPAAPLFSGHARTTPELVAPQNRVQTEWRFQPSPTPKRKKGPIGLPLLPLRRWPDCEFYTTHCQARSI